MIVHRNLDRCSLFKNTILTIGSFDGIHCGHQKILARMFELAKSNHLETVLLSFEPHPKIALAHLKNERAQIKLLNSIDEKISILEKMGLDHLVLVPFDKDFSLLSPEAYIANFLCAHFHPKIIVIGYDHRFGFERNGSIDDFIFYQKKYNYEVVEISKKEIDDISVSSTKIRKALEATDIDKANKFLGYPYLLSGVVVKGDQIGRTIGFPTANLQIDNPYKLIPPDGVYSCKVQIKQNSFSGMLYIGNRPTLNLLLDKKIEVFLFDFNQQIYGEHMVVEIHAFIRPDLKFANLSELKIQLQEDEQIVRTNLTK
jgi:riboflavin kinase/FMN adenylyltransferase